MCLIAVAPRAHLIPRDNLQNAFDHNSDGWGIMYARGGRVVTLKERAGLNRFFNAWETVPRDVPVAVHFRFGTSGPKNDDMCHPFKILDKDKHGMDLYMMHNGVLREFRGDSKRSDTLEMVQDVLTPMLAGSPKFVRTDAFAKIADIAIGGGNKLVFLEGGGRWHFINKQAGKQISKVWYSNEYSIEKVYSGHGKGKAASRTAPSAVSHDGFDYGEAYGRYGAPYYGHEGRYAEARAKWHEPEKSGSNAVVIHKPQTAAGALLPSYMARNAATGVIEYTGPKATVQGADNSQGSAVMMVPMMTGPETAQLTTSNMREATIVALSSMGAAPKPDAKVLEAVRSGATLGDSNDTLEMQWGISRKQLAQYIYDGCDYVIKNAKGEVGEVYALRNRAFAALKESPVTLESIADACRVYETPLDKLAREARTGQGATPLFGECEGHAGETCDAMCKTVGCKVLQHASGNGAPADEADAEEQREREISDMFWQDDNLRASSPQEIFEGVVDDPDGATDYIMEKLGLVAWQQ